MYIKVEKNNIMLLQISVLLALAAVGVAVEPSLTKITDAADKGAVCLDGSPPAYYYRKGTTEHNKWLLWFLGGMFCQNEVECLERSHGPHGSTKSWSEKLPMTGGLFSDDCDENPHFCGWTLVVVIYCDGAIFSGNVIDPVLVGEDIIYFRGIRIFDAVIDDIQTRGFDSAEHVILGGVSTGGLGTYLHIDRLRMMIPGDTPLHGLSDGGYFVDVPNVNGEYRFRAGNMNMFKLHNISGGVNQDCVMAMSRSNEEWKCLFPQYSTQFIETPVYTINCFYDAYQVEYILELKCLPPDCSEDEMKQFDNFYQDYYKALNPVIQSPSSGTYVVSCLVHCLVHDKNAWTQYKVADYTMMDAVHSWIIRGTTSFSHKNEFYKALRSALQLPNVCLEVTVNSCSSDTDQTESWKADIEKNYNKHHKIDCAYPCNPTLQHEAEVVTIY